MRTFRMDIIIYFAKINVLSEILKEMVSKLVIIEVQSVLV